MCLSRYINTCACTIHGNARTDVFVPFVCTWQLDGNRERIVKLNEPSLEYINCKIVCSYGLFTLECSYVKLVPLAALLASFL